MKDEQEQEHGAEHWGAELAFAERVVGIVERRRGRRGACLLFWSDWSGLKHPAKTHCADEAGEGARWKRRRDHKEMPVPYVCVYVVVGEGGGSGCKAEGHSPWPLSRPSFLEPG